MRELYACQLDLATGDLSGVEARVRQWIRNPSRATDEQLEPNNGRVTTSVGHQLEVSAAGGGGQGWTCSWTFPSDTNDDLLWRLQLGVGPAPDGAEPTTVFSLRTALARRNDRRLAPAQYEFRSPAIIRTLLRDYTMTDGTVQVLPAPRLCGPGDVPQLIELLLHADRQLPVLLITLRNGRPRTDPAELSRQLAGLAHVVVLTSPVAARLLSDQLGSDLSVWSGAIRLYWPGLALDDDPGRHRYWTAQRVDTVPDFVALQRNWLGGLAAAVVADHPAAVALRAERRRRVAEDHLPAWVEQYVADTDAELDATRSEIVDLQSALTESQRAEVDLRSELEDVRRQFHLVYASSEIDGDMDPGEVEPLDIPPALDVADAFRLAVDRAGDHVFYLESAHDSVADFTSYANPDRLYEALALVNEAAELWAADQLTSGFGAYFHSHGWEYGQKNPAAVSKPTKHHYQRQWNGATVTMKPHLKVDQATSPDQCLRIYWYTDEATKTLVIGHVGRHLPD